MIGRSDNSLGARQRADVRVDGDYVVIDCYEVIEPANSNWRPDNFYVVRRGDRLSGYSMDDSGSRGVSIDIFR